MLKPAARMALIALLLAAAPAQAREYTLAEAVDSALAGSDEAAVAGRRRAMGVAPVYKRIDAPATKVQKERLASLSPDAVRNESLAGDAIVHKLTRAPATVTGEMYFLEIEGFHNHAVGRLQILVHNGKQKGLPPSFTADHPFLFFIRDEPTGSILFMGRVMDPTKE